MRSLPATTPTVTLAEGCLANSAAIMVSIPAQRAVSSATVGSTIRLAGSSRPFWCRTNPVTVPVAVILEADFRARHAQEIILLAKGKDFKSRLPGELDVQVITFALHSYHGGGRQLVAACIGVKDFRINLG